jgi:amphi-Trp domain-containing protein
MSDVKVELKESLTRQQAADRLSAFAKALSQGGEVDLELGGTSVSLGIPEELRGEFEVEVDGDEFELELELKWSSARAKGPAKPAEKAKRPEPRGIPSL